MQSLCHVRFYTKAGCSEERLGACPFCQRVHMVLAQKRDAGLLDFELVRVNLSKPPVHFRQVGLRHVPALVYREGSTEDEETIDSADEIVAFLDQRFPTDDPDDDPAAAWAAKDFFSCFCRYIKEVAKDASGMTSSLRRLDGHLSANLDRRFLCGDQISHLDCEVLPKLQHLRVASRGLRGYEIPTEMGSLWRYLHDAYANPSFLETCPCDQEILMHWAEKPDTIRAIGSEDRARLAKEKPRFSIHVPAVATPVQIE